MGDVLAFIGSWRSTQAANAQAEGQAATANANAEIMRQNAANEAVNRENALRTNRQKYNILTGQARAQAGALGMFGGSSLDVLSDINNQGIFETQSIVSSSVNTQQNYNNQGAVYKAQSKNLLASRQSPWVNAGLATLQYDIGMATSVATMGLGGGGAGGMAGKP